MINYRIVVDSCGEFTEDMKKNPHFAHAALHLSIDGEQFVDDETFDRLDFLAKMKESPNCPKSSCPSPEVYRAAFDCGAEHLCDHAVRRTEWFLQQCSAWHEPFSGESSRCKSACI